jgi:hypothetical protein
MRFSKISNSFDYNKHNGGTSFKACHKNWRQDSMIDDFQKWGIKSFGESLFCLKENTLMHWHFRGLTDQQQ